MLNSVETTSTDDDYDDDNNDEDDDDDDEYSRFTYSNYISTTSGKNQIKM